MVLLVYLCEVFHQWVRGGGGGGAERLLLPLPPLSPLVFGRSSVSFGSGEPLRALSLLPASNIQEVRTFLLEGGHNRGHDHRQVHTDTVMRYYVL